MPNGMAGRWMEIEQELCMPAPNKLQPAVKIYRDIFDIWNSFQAGISYPDLSWPTAQLKSELSRGKHLLENKPLPLDRPFFRKIFFAVVEAAARHYPQAGYLLNRLRLETEEKLELSFLYDQAACLGSGSLRGYIFEQPWIAQSGLDPALIGYLIFMAAVPFYLNFAVAAGELVDLSIWQQGRCPVCGQLPMMAKLRAEDGARILECGLCHQQWQFPRLECPFCRNRDFQQQQYFYADEFPGRRVQLCECCKGYLKTVVVKEIGHEVVLEIENLFTWQLDSLARKEGYHSGEELALLAINWQGG